MNLGTVWRMLKALKILKSAETEASTVTPTTAKPWYASMTIWTSALGALLVNFTPEIQTFIAGHPKISALVAAVTAILLRFKTDKPVA